MASGEEQQCLVELCLQRKAINYEELKEWDKQRAQQLQLHLKSVEQLTEYVDTSLRQSESYFRGVLQFMESKSQQYKILLADQPTIQQPIPYDREDWEKMERTSNFYCKQHTTFQQMQRILTEEHLPRLQKILSVEFSKQLGVLRDRIGNENEQLKDIVKVVQRRCGKLSDSYHKEKKETTFRCKIDLYARQQSFVVAALLQTDVQKKLGIHASNYLQAAIESEVERHSTLRDVLCNFYKLHLLLDQSKPDGILKLAEIEDSSKMVIGKLYAPQLLMDATTYSKVLSSIFKGQPQTPTITIDELKTYLTCLSFHTFSSRNLVLKEFELGCCRNSKPSATALVRLTIDGFLHIYENIHNAKGLIYKSDVFCKLDRHVRLTDLSSTVLELAHRENIRCRHSNEEEDNRLELTFVSEDSKIEFSELVRSMHLPGSERVL